MKTIDRIKDILAEYLGYPVDEITEDSHISDCFGADSLDAIEILMAIEEEFDLEISDEDAEKVGLVVKDIVAAVDAAINS